MTGADGWAVDRLAADSSGMSLLFQVPVVMESSVVSMWWTTNRANSTPRPGVVGAGRET